MDCHLTLGLAICLLAGGSAWGDPASRQPDHQTIVADATALSIHWEGVPLEDAIGRVALSSNTPIFVDRRVDRNQRIDLSVEVGTAYDILEKLAATRALGVARLDALLYLGPTHAAGELTALAELRRADLSRLSTEEQQALSKRDAITWPRLTEPRDLVARFVQDRGWQVVGSERIPYDLWPAGRLPKITMSDALTVLLVGFDLTYRPMPGKRTIEIVPIADEELASVTSAAGSAGATRASPSSPKRATSQRYTLRVQEQPVGKVLDQLGRQIHLDVKVDTAAIEAAGRSMDKRVSFDVKNADLTALLDALLRPAGLTYQRDGDQLTILPQ
jgi:type II secretory pathway component GspD/PulD (secretin)